MNSSDKSHRIAFFGTSDFAVPILQKLASDPYFEILEVVTQPDKPVGRHKAFLGPIAKRAAKTLNLPVYQPKNLKNDKVVAHLKKLNAELFVVISYGQLLPKNVLELPPFGCINVHASTLPKFRGASPISTAIIKGEDMTGVTIMKMDEGMDTGPILAASPGIAIKDDDTTQTLSIRLQETASELLGPILKLYLEDQIKPKAQDESLASVTKLLKREDGLIDWKQSVADVERTIRALQPWPGTFTVWKQNKGAEVKILIKKTEILHLDSGCGTGQTPTPGQVCKLNDGSMAIECGKGSLTVVKIQMEGRNETDGKSFINGYPEVSGSVLG